VSGNDIYVAWVENSGSDMAKIWHNGSYTNLTSGLTNADVRALFISGNDIYAAGSEDVFNGHFIAKYWKNGVATNLTDGSVNSVATSILASGPDVYVTGVEGASNAKVWKNGVLTNLSTAPNSHAAGLYQYGSDLYYMGAIGNRGMMWKNGDPFPITDGSTTTKGNCISISQ
jgi:hypothetical protein